MFFLLNGCCLPDTKLSSLTTEDSMALYSSRLEAVYELNCLHLLTYYNLQTSHLLQFTSNAESLDLSRRFYAFYT